MNIRSLSVLVSALLGALSGSVTYAQSAVFEDFTSTTTTNPWFYSGGACLTASGIAGTGTEFTQTTAGTAGTIPGCTAIRPNSDAYNGETLVGGYNGTFPDPVGNGSLRFTNGCIGGGSCGSGGHNQFGAIISGNTFSSTAGVQVTFKTVTYRGDSLGAGADGADGISFFLMDGSVSPNIGQYGGSLAYTCSNQNGNYGYGGVVGGYLGLGIDEYGNFLNGSNNTLGETGSTATNGGNGDNTASGGLYKPNRIGLRGAGNIAWPWLNANYPTQYPSTLTIAQRAAAVRATCLHGTVQDSSSGTLTSTSTPVADYAAIPGAYNVLSGVTIANEYSNGARLRSDGTPILYKLKITTDGLLSLSYSFNGGAYQSVLQNQSITASNGAVPANLRFGFAGSTGGSSNIHEVLCFKAASADTSSSSATTNQTQSSRVTSSTQAYFSYYDPNDWTGRLTSNSLTSDSSGNLTIATTANWDASCVLSGVNTGATCPTTGASGPVTAQPPANTATNGRVILTWNGTSGVPFEFTNLTTAQATALNLGDTTSTANRLNFLRGDRSNEITTSGSGLYRDRDFQLGDIVDSSPVAVGQPASPYSITWKDKLYPTATAAETSGAQTYTQYIAAQQTRQNVVYVGANDGMLHGFRSGAFNSSNVYDPTTNDGLEVLAYVPGAVLQSAASSSTSTACASTVATQTIAQNIHGETPLIGGTPACFNPTLDYSNLQYGHNFFVDATPATGDLFYGTSASTASWHTWLVSGLGPGGSAIFALDITTPSNFSEGTAAAASTVIGEWTPSTLTCAIVSNCGRNLGNTYGTPLIRRLHDGNWAVIFGNGFNSASGDAGVYIMTINATTAVQTFYYLSTGTTGTGNGIAYVTSTDLDGDRVVDYLYAGDLLGNVWKFDLTSSSESSWAASSAPLFAGGATHPITSSVLVAKVTHNYGTQVMVAFGTGQKTPLTNINSASYPSAQQYLYAFWDWNFSTWNTAVPGVQYTSLTASASATGMSNPYTLTPAKLTAQTLALGSSGNIDLSSSTICWRGSTTCGVTASLNNRFGWSAALPGTNEQIIYNPQLVGSAFTVNSIIPASSSLLSCTTSLDSGISYAIDFGSGGVAAASSGSTSFFVNTTQTSVSNGVTTTTVVTNTDAATAGVATNATGTSTIVTTSTTASSASLAAGGAGVTTTCLLSGNCLNFPGNISSMPGPFANVTGCSAGNTYLVYQTTSGNASYYRVAPQCPLIGSRTTRTQVR
jgi:type IV pilus assembly protein PilY1